MLQSETFCELVQDAGTQYATEPFLIQDDLLGRVSYADVLRFARGVNTQLDEMGIAPGAPVASILHNCGLAALLFLAIIAARRIYVPLNPIASRNELLDMLERSGCAAVILDPTHARSDDLGDRHLIRIHDHGDYYRQRYDGAPGRELMNAQSDVAAGEIVFTSGSTGQPKGVVLTERNLLANARALANAYHLDRDDRFLTVCPLFHNSGQVFTTLACTLVGGSTAAIKSDVGMLQFWEHVRKYRAHWSLGMTSFLALLLTRGDGPREWTGMRALLTGGSVIDAGLIQRFEARFGIPVRTVYGLTESSSIATCEHIDPSPRSLGSSGRVLASCDVRIGVEPGALAAPPHPKALERGEVWISGATIFDSYVGDESLTQFRKRDGWLRTGDLGFFDENGNLFVIDRLDSMLIVGGENVYPAEVEKLCMSLPGAAQILLTGVDHPIWGTALVLVYKSSMSEPAPLVSWHRVLTEQLAAFKQPRHYLSLNELGLEDFPRKENGKLDRRRVAALVAAHLSKPQQVATGAG